MVGCLGWNKIAILQLLLWGPFDLVGPRPFHGHRTNGRRELLAPWYGIPQNIPRQCFDHYLLRADFGLWVGGNPSPRLLRLVFGHYLLQADFGLWRGGIHPLVFFVWFSVIIFFMRTSVSEWGEIHFLVFFLWSPIIIFFMRVSIPAGRGSHFCLDLGEGSGWTRFLFGNYSGSGSSQLFVCG